MRVCKIWLVLALATGLGAIAFGQSVADSGVVKPKHVLERQVAIRGLEKITIERAFREAMSSGNVPGGIVLPGDCAKEDEYQLDIASTTLRDVLDSIVSAAPSYRWQYRRGVVNLIEVRDGTALLGLRIKRFKVNNAKTLSGALSDLMNLSEVKRRLEEVNISQVKQEIGLTDLRRSDSGMDGDTQGFSVSCSNVTFREALNAIVSANGKGAWAYLERHCNGRDEIRINFIVQ
jgi:hypothetical protein